MRTHVKFTPVNEIEAMYKSRARFNFYKNQLKPTGAHLESGKYFATGAETVVCPGNPHSLLDEHNHVPVLYAAGPWLGNRIRLHICPVLLQ